MLTELHTFANRPENIREVFLISFHDHRPNVENDPSGNCNSAIGSAVLQTLCENVAECPVVYRTHGNRRQWFSLADMLRRGKRYVIASNGHSGKPFINPLTATGYFDIPPPRWPTFLVTLFPILKEGMGLSLLDEFEVQYHVIKK